MTNEWLPTDLRNFAIALFIGALVGVDREKKRHGDPNTIGGIRTFILFAMLGAVGAWLTLKVNEIWIFLVAFAMVSLAVLSGYLRQARLEADGVGMTTEIAAMVVCLLGATCLFGYPEIAVTLGIITSAVLAYKDPIHGVVEKIGRDDLFAGLKLLIATFIVLPLLPNRPLDPLGALNPSQIWLLAILISLLSLIGYVAVRWLGPRRGTALTGLFGGLVSSTVVSFSFSKRSKEEAKVKGSGEILAIGLLLSWFMMFVRVPVEVAIVHQPLLRPLTLPVAAMGVSALIFAGALYLRMRRRESATPSPPEIRLENPFSLWSALKFAGFFAFILLVVKWVQEFSSPQGFYWIAALAGLTDMDAITLSMAKYAREGGETIVAIRSIMVAALTNTAIKCGLVVTLGTGPLRQFVIGATALIIATGSLAIWLL